MDPFRGLIGIPFRDRGRTREGADCWGLTRLALSEVAGVQVPAYDANYASASERRANAELIAGEKGDWFAVPTGSERALDVVILRDGRHESHLALVTQPGRMLHTYQDGTSCVDRYDESPFAEKVVGFYRHRKLAHGLD